MPRTKKRLSCNLVVNDQRYTGIVIDVSASGLFVQTSVAPKPGSSVELELQLPSGDFLPLHATVARRRSVPARLRSVVRCGLGLSLEHVPEAFFSLVEELQGPREAVPQKEATPRPKAAAHSDLA
ncbi:MAG: PilZ domain-containing protein, partial [Deltaproteobacteria bacterium]|nr:PilZ domain-containing protein [Deltaproteobacteria bacterium]